MHPENFSYINSHVSLSAQDGFEGPEKRFEVVFGYKHEIINSEDSYPTLLGLRSIPQDDWQKMLDLANCTIISTTSNNFVTSYVLSESSLFVYYNKIVLKTCGTTTLLNCIDTLIEYGDRVGAHVQFVVFSRKNFNFPHKQPHPHSNFQTEVQLLNRKFDGSAHIVGPVMSNGDHHFIYFANLQRKVRENHVPNCSHPFGYESDDVEQDDSSSNEDEWVDSPDDSRMDISQRRFRPTLEILMSELSTEKMKQFYKDENFIDAKTTTKTVGLSKLLPDFITDEFVFDPCGYSLNAINNIDGSYATVHVTPEPHCSFVSFETDIECNDAHRTALIQSIIQIFCPGRFSVVITSNEQTSPLELNFKGYSSKFKTKFEFNEGFRVAMQNFSAQKRVNRIPN